MEHDSKVWEQNLVERFWGSFVRWADSIRPLGHEEGERVVDSFGGISGEEEMILGDYWSVWGKRIVGEGKWVVAARWVQSGQEAQRVKRANSSRTGKTGQAG
ncbi:hypothetical protein ACLOJK_018787 [Asimina triloba]